MTKTMRRIMLYAVAAVMIAGSAAGCMGNGVQATKRGQVTETLDETDGQPLPSEGAVLVENETGQAVMLYGSIVQDETGKLYIEDRKSGQRVEIEREDILSETEVQLSPTGSEGSSKTEGSGIMSSSAVKTEVTSVGNKGTASGQEETTTVPPESESSAIKPTTAKSTADSVTTTAKPTTTSAATTRPAATTTPATVSTTTIKPTTVKPTVVTTTTTKQTTTPTTTTKPTTISTTTAKPTTAPTTAKPTTVSTTTAKPTTVSTTTAKPEPTETTIVWPPVRDVPKLRQWMFDATNEVRKEYGVPPLAQGSPAMQEIAMIRAEDLATRYSHIRPGTKDTYYDNMLDDYGFPLGWSGENIAKFTPTSTAESVLDAWVSSNGHRSNIIEPMYDTLAVGYYQDQLGFQYWVQIFYGEYKEGQQSD